ATSWRPPSAFARTSGRPAIGFRSSTLSRITRSRPGRSVTSMLPSGRNARAQKWTRSLFTTVTRIHDGDPNLLLLRCVKHERACTQPRDEDADGRLLTLGYEEHGQQHRHRRPSRRSSKNARELHQHHQISPPVRPMLSLLDHHPSSSADPSHVV